MARTENLMLINIQCQGSSWNSNCWRMSGFSEEVLTALFSKPLFCWTISNTGYQPWWTGTLTAWPVFCSFSSLTFAFFFINNKKQTWKQSIHCWICATHKNLRFLHSFLLSCLGNWLYGYYVLNHALLS